MCLLNLFEYIFYLPTVKPEVVSRYVPGTRTDIKVDCAYLALDSSREFLVISFAGLSLILSPCVFYRMH